MRLTYSVKWIPSMYPGCLANLCVLPYVNTCAADRSKLRYRRVSFVDSLRLWVPPRDVPQVRRAAAEVGQTACRLALDQSAEACLQQSRLIINAREASRFVYQFAVYVDSRYH